MFNCAWGATSLYGPVFTMSPYMLAVRFIAFSGDDEELALKLHFSQTNAPIAILPGSHHFNNDFRKTCRTDLERLFRNQIKEAQRPVTNFVFLCIFVILWQKFH